MSKSKLRERVFDNLPTVAGILDSLNLGAIYSSYLTEALLKAYQNTGHFICLPITLACSFIYTVFAWRTALLKRNRKENGNLKAGYVVPALVNTACFLVLATAVILSCIAVIKFATVSSLFFGLNLAINSLYNIGASFFYAGKAKAMEEKGTELQPLLQHTSERDALASKKQEYRARSIAHAIVGTISALTALAGFMTVLMGQKLFAGLGMAVGIVGAVLGCVSLGRTIQQEWKKSNEAIGLATESSENDQATPANTLEITATLMGRQPVRDDFKVNEKPALRRINSAPIIRFDATEVASFQEDDSLIISRPLARSSAY